MMTTTGERAEATKKFFLLFNEQFCSFESERKEAWQKLCSVEMVIDGVIERKT